MAQDRVLRRDLVIDDDPDGWVGQGLGGIIALLLRGELSDLLWRRSMNIAGRARRDGTNRMTLLEDLVRWGEDHTTYEYNERYIRR